jgi:hypothetical protein
MVIILAGVNDMMGFEVLTNAVGSPAKWSKVVASNAIGIRPVKLLDLGIVDWIRESFHSRSIEDDGVPPLTQNGTAEAFLGSFAARPSLNLVSEPHVQRRSSHDLLRSCRAARWVGIEARRIKAFAECRGNENREYSSTASRGC